MSRVLPGIYTLVIPQRATLEEPIALELETENGFEPVNLTGFTIIAQVWKDEKRHTKLADLTVNYTDRAMGSFVLSLTRAQTRAITAGGFWDLLVIEPSGAADYWLEGPVEVNIGLSDDQ